jgi:hypothetical protein
MSVWIKSNGTPSGTEIRIDGRRIDHYIKSVRWTLDASEKDAVCVLEISERFVNVDLQANDAVFENLRESDESQSPPLDSLSEQMTTKEGEESRTDKHRQQETTREISHCIPSCRFQETGEQNEFCYKVTRKICTY